MPTTNLNLFTYNVKANGDIGFDDLRAFINGSGSSSNMVKFDTFSGQLALDISNLITGYSGSDLLISGSITSASAQVEASGSQITDIISRFDVIGNFSGAGQADFSSISQDYTHLLIIGNAGVNNSEYITNVGIDFNGDVLAGRYHFVTWGVSGSAYTYNPTFNLDGFFNKKYSIIGKSSGSENSYYGGTIFSVIPYYSASSTLYKSFMGQTTLVQDSGSLCSYNVGGVWKTTDPINRIRIFGVDILGTKCDFVDGSEITVYGLE